MVCTSLFYYSACRRSANVPSEEWFQRALQATTRQHTYYEISNFCTDAFNLCLCQPPTSWSTLSSCSRFLCPSCHAATQRICRNNIWWQRDNDCLHPEIFAVPDSPRKVGERKKTPQSGRESRCKRTRKTKQCRIKTKIEWANNPSALSISNNHSARQW